MTIPIKATRSLKERGYPDEIRRAIMSHAEYTGVTRDTRMEKALFACDELAGFITAVALIKPGKSLAEVDAKSVRKRMKDKAFARKVNRDDIVNGAAGLGVELERAHHILHRSNEATGRKAGAGRKRRQQRLEHVGTAALRLQVRYSRESAYFNTSATFPLAISSEIRAKS